MNVSPASILFLLISITLLCRVGCAHADGGAINFSGAVFEPTCSPAAVNIGKAQNEQVVSNYRCARTMTTSNSAMASESRIYAMSVNAGSVLPSDRLIGYLAHYQNNEPMLVTQTYE